LGYWDGPDFAISPEMYDAAWDAEFLDHLAAGPTRTCGASASNNSHAGDSHLGAFSGDSSRNRVTLGT